MNAPSKKASGSKSTSNRRRWVPEWTQRYQLDTFQDDLLAPPVYTRPQEIDGLNVPEILISGNTKLVEDWRLNQSIERTKLLRPDLYDKFSGKK